MQFHWFYSLVSLLLWLCFSEYQSMVTKCVPPLGHLVVEKGTSLNPYRYSQWASSFHQALPGREGISIFFSDLPSIKPLFHSLWFTESANITENYESKSPQDKCKQLTPVRLKHFSNWSIFISNLLLQIINYSKNLKV